MGITLRWDVTNICNMNCIHCYSSESRKKSDKLMTIADYQKIIAVLPKNSIRIIKLMGGEPFDCNEIYEISECLDRREIPFGITTNGMFDLNQETINLISRKMFKYITFSVDGINSKTAKTLRKNSDLDKIFTNITYILSNYTHLPVSIILILNKDNCKEILTILNYFEKMGIHKICLSALSGINEKIKEFICDELDYKNIILDANTFLKTNPKMIVQLNFSCNKLLYEDDLSLELSDKVNLEYRCRAAREIGYIDWCGNLFPCEAVTSSPFYNQHLESNKFSLLNNSFWDVWNLEYFDHVYEFDMNFVNLGKVSQNHRCYDCNVPLKNCSICYYKEFKEIENNSYDKDPVIDYLKDKNKNFRIIEVGDLIHLYDCVSNKEYRLQNSVLYVINLMLEDKISNTTEINSLINGLTKIGFNIK